VLFIAIDDLNDWLTCMGGLTGVHTPHLDRLARSGTLFESAYCTSPACAPSRTSIMTGRRPSTSGVYRNHGYFWRENPVLEDVTALPEHFRDNGYRAAGGGKLYHALPWIREGYGLNQNDPRSWDAYFPSMERAIPEVVRPVEATKSDNGAYVWDPVATGDGEGERVPPRFFDWAPLEEPASATSDHRVVDWAISELERDHDQPFFLGAGILRPHIPWYVPQTFYDQYPLEDIVVPPAPPGDLDDLPPRGQQIGSGRRHWHEWLLEEGLWAEAMQGYLASVSFTDAQVGRLLDALESSDHADDTVVVLWSDHGFHLGEKEAWEKFTLWEESGRVPLMIRAPGVTEPRQRCDEPVSLLDLYPTLTELCGLKTPEGVEGQSLVPLLEDPNRDTDRVAITTWNYQNHSVRSKRWRYIRYRTGEEELYDHDFDPGEYHNLADQEAYEPIKERLAARLPEVNRRAYDP
jgi:arylsulfatase A-like enzyme